MSARFSATERAAIDQARGDIDGSVWLRTAALAYLGATTAKPPARGKPARTEPPPMKAASPGPLPQPSTPQPMRCTHSGTRVIGGYCKHCDHLIEPGGRWRT